MLVAFIWQRLTSEIKLLNKRQHTKADCRGLVSLHCAQVLPSKFNRNFEEDARHKMKKNSCYVGRLNNWMFENYDKGPGARENKTN